MVQHPLPLARSVSTHIPKELLSIVAHGTNACGYTLTCTYLAQVGRLVSICCRASEFQSSITTVTLHKKLSNKNKSVELIPKAQKGKACAEALDLDWEI